MANQVSIARTQLSRGYAPSPGFSDDGRLAWRIRIQCSDDSASFAIPFARRCDAERGLASIKKLMTFDGTFEEVRARILDIGVERIRRAACESLAW